MKLAYDICWRGSNLDAYKRTAAGHGAGLRWELVVAAPALPVSVGAVLAGAVLLTETRLAEVVAFGLAELGGVLVVGSPSGMGGVVFHSSRPWTPSSARKKSVPLTAESGSGEGTALASVDVSHEMRAGGSAVGLPQFISAAFQGRSKNRASHPNGRPGRDI